MPRRYTSASEDLNEPRVYVNNMNTRHPTTGLPNSRPSKISAGASRGGPGQGSVLYGASTHSSLPPLSSFPGSAPPAAASVSRAQVRVVVPDTELGADTTRSAAVDLHPNLEQVYSRIMRRLQRQVNYEELNRVSLADQFGIRRDDVGESDADDTTEAIGAAAPRQQTASATARRSPATSATGVVPASSFVRFTAERTHTADDADVDDAELSLSSQPCPRTLRLVVQHVQSILDKKLQVAEQGSLKDCLRFTFESRALLDRLLKEIPSYTQYRDEAALLELDKAAAAASSSRLTTTATGHSSGGVSRQQLQAMFEEFRKEPVLMPHAVFVQDPLSGTVEATLSTAQELAAQRLVTGATADVTSEGGEDPGAEGQGGGEGSADAGLPPIHAARVPALTAVCSTTTAGSSSVGSPRNAARVAPGSVQVIHSTNDTGLSSQYTKLAKHLVGVASPNTKSRTGASTVGVAAGTLSLPETYAKSVRLQQQSAVGTLARPLADGVTVSEPSRGSYTHAPSAGSDWASRSTSTTTTAVRPGDHLLVVDDETGELANDENDNDDDDAPPTARSRDASTAPSDRNRAQREQRFRALVEHSTPSRRATQRVDAATLTDENGLTAVPVSEYEALQAYARDLEVRLAEGRQLQEDLRHQLLQESGYAEQKRRIVQYLRKTLVRECNTLRSQLTFASHRERHLQAALKEANTTLAATATGGGNPPPGSSLTLATSTSIGARRSLFSSGRQGSLTPPTQALNPPAVAGSASQTNALSHNNNNSNSDPLDEDVAGIQSLLDLVLLGVENDETLAMDLDVIKRMSPEEQAHALKPNPNLAQEQLRAELDERQRQLKEIILSLKVKHTYEMAAKNREIEQLQHLTDIEYIHAQLSASVKKVRAEFRSLRNALTEELHGFRVMMAATVKSLANRARLMDQVAQENSVLQNTLDASTDLIESATNLFIPMLTSEYTHGYHPWPVKLRNTIDPLSHLVQVRHGAAEVIRLRPSLDGLSDLYLAIHAFVTRSVVLPDATRHAHGRVLKELCSALLRSPSATTDVLYEVRRLYEREHQLTRQLARVNAKLLWNSYLQNAYSERSMAALSEAALDPRTTTLPVQRRINALAEQRRELAKARAQLERERVDNAKEVYRIWRDKQIDINEGYAPPLVTNRLTLLSEAQVHAAQRRGGDASVAVRTNATARD